MYNISIFHLQKLIMDVNVDEVNNIIIQKRRLPNEVLDNLLAQNINYNDFINFLKNRCTTKNRNMNIIKKEAGSDNIFDLIKLTNGEVSTDFLTISCKTINKGDI